VSHHRLGVHPPLLVDEVDFLGGVAKLPVLFLAELLDNPFAVLAEGRIHRQIRGRECGVALLEDVVGLGQHPDRGGAE
jgi:hypothetical protein